MGDDPSRPIPHDSFIADVAVRLHKLEEADRERRQLVAEWNKESDLLREEIVDLRAAVAREIQQSIDIEERRDNARSLVARAHDHTKRVEALISNEEQRYEEVLELANRSFASSRCARDTVDRFRKWTVFACLCAAVACYFAVLAVARLS